MNKEEILRKNLETLTSKINEHKAIIDGLREDKNKIKEELYKIIESKSTIIDYNDIENVDPIEYLLANTKDDDEIELKDMAYIFGMSLSTLRSKIDKTQITRYDKFDRHGTKLVRTTIKYLKEFLGNSKPNEKMIECIKYILKYHHENRKPISVDVPIKDLEIPLEEYATFRKLTITELVTRGLGRGFFVKPQLNSIQRLLFAYSIGYKLQWLRSRFMRFSYTVVKEPIRFTFRIYHKEK